MELTEFKQTVHRRGIFLGSVMGVVYLREQELEVVRFRKVKTYHYERIQHFSLVKKWRLARASSFFVLVQQEPRFKIQLADGDTLELFF